MVPQNTSDAEKVQSSVENAKNAASTDAINKPKIEGVVGSIDEKGGTLSGDNSKSEQNDSTIERDHLVDEYLKSMQAIAIPGYDVSFPDNKRPGTRIPISDNAKKREEFSRCKDNLIRCWEVKNKRDWPTYDEDFIFTNRRGQSKIQRRKGDRFDAHHIIPLCLGGTNTVDNIVPMHAKNHFDKQGVHAPGGPFSKLMEIK